MASMVCGVAPLIPPDLCCTFRSEFAQQWRPWRRSRRLLTNMKECGAARKKIVDALVSDSMSATMSSFDAMQVNALPELESEDDAEEDEDAAVISAPNDMEDEGEMGDSFGVDEYVSDVEGDEDVIEDEDDESDDSELDSRVQRSSETSTSIYNGIEERAQKILKLLAKDAGQNRITRGDLVSLYDFPLDRFQRRAIRYFLKGSSVVVCAPTSSGKTLIAEAAAVAAMAKGKQFFYTTPLKALSNQKYREFRAVFGESSVGLLTGDICINRDAPIVIMTAEILRNKFYLSARENEEASLLVNVHVVVLDEVHYLSDVSRGTVWEELVIYCPKGVQLLCLSATVSNPDELMRWIRKVHGPTVLVVSSKRPVPLTWHFSTRLDLLPLLDKKDKKKMNRELLIKIDNGEQEWDDRRGKKASRYRKRNNDELEIELSPSKVQALRRMQVPKISNTLEQIRKREMLPAIWFIFSRKGCDDAVSYLQDVNLLTDDESVALMYSLENFRKQYPEAVRESSVKFLLQGIAAHHAGCLPLWKGFIEERFQEGLIKIIFATETLAAGINMPARSAVLSSISRRSSQGITMLSANSLLQIAGRAGRRGIDTQGHVVLMQTPFQGPEDCCKLLLSGADALVSQFTATYGMALNLLLREGPNASELPKEHTLEKARALIERSFGNFIASEIMIGWQEELRKMHEDMLSLKQELSVDVEENFKAKLGEETFLEYSEKRNKAKSEKQMMKELENKIDTLKVATVTFKLEETVGDYLPFISLRYKRLDGESQLMSAIYMGSITNFLLATYGDKEVAEFTFEGLGDIQYYMALGFDDCWYIFTAQAVQDLYKLGIAECLGQKSLLALMKEAAGLNNQPWKRIGSVEADALGNIWCAKSTLDTLPWSAKVPLPSKINQSHNIPKEILEAEKLLDEQRKKFTISVRELKRTKGFQTRKLMREFRQMQEQKYLRFKVKAARLEARIKNTQPSGWKEFLQVVNVLKAAGAVDAVTHALLPLGHVALSVRGGNELWLALAFQSKKLLSMKAPELAAVVGTLVGEGIKTRSEYATSILYEPSSAVDYWIDEVETIREWVLQLQYDNNVELPCDLDPHLAGIVEAWADGVNWRELTANCGMDEGDVARLLHRSIDLLAQIPFFPDVDAALAKTAKHAAYIMDRPPIKEVIN